MSSLTAKQAEMECNINDAQSLNIGDPSFACVSGEHVNLQTTCWTLRKEREKERKEVFDSVSCFSYPTSNSWICG